MNGSAVSQPRANTELADFEAGVAEVGVDHLEVEARDGRGESVQQGGRIEDFPQAHI